MRRIWAVGHGDSYFAPLAAAEAFHRWTRLDYTPALSQEMAAYPPRGLDDGALVIAVSMSGGVEKTIAAAKAARARGARVLAVTNTTGSPLTEAAHDTIFLNIAEAVPFLAGTVTYTASLLALLKIAALLSDLQDRARPPREALSAAVDAIRLALASESTLRAWTATHASAPVWYVLGMGAQEATGRYGAAKLVEVADVVGVAHETEEFFHEHHWVARPEHPVVLLSHDEASRQRTLAAVAHLRELRIPVAVVGDVDVSDDVLRVSVPVVESCTSPLVVAVPLQWLAYWLSRARGLDPDTRGHLRGSARYVVSRKYR
ncbi:MAG TPA: SIS domain-containing protein [bacterium]|nr:SIS domain-containing protein [bacterium]